MMTLAIDPNAEIPPYEQLRRRLIEQISMGQLPKDTKLPAVRRLAADLALAPGTIVLHNGHRTHRLEFSA